MQPPTSSDAGRPAQEPLATGPRVSIVITYYRQGSLVRDAIASALGQDYPNVEVVVVDDGSPPGEEAAPIVADYPGARLVRKPNGGVSSARNVGWRASGGEYVVFLDGDDTLLPHAVSTGVRVLGEHPECGFVHGVSERRALDGRLLEVREPLVGAFDHFEALLRRNFVRGLHAVMLRRTAVEAVGGYDERQPFANDWEFFLRVARRFPGFGHGEVIATYRRHAGNVNSNRNAARMLAASLLALDKQRAAVGSDPRLRAAMAEGRQWVRDLFGRRLLERMVAELRAREWGAASASARVLVRYDPARLLGHGPAAVARRLGVLGPRPSERRAGS